MAFFDICSIGRKKYLSVQNGIGASAAAAAAAIQQQKFIENFLSEQTAANNSIVEKIQLQQGWQFS